MKSYDYIHRTGVRRISWADFARLAALLSEGLEPFQPHIILGNAKGGLFPATLVACSLRREFFPIRLTRRINDQVKYEQPVWKVPPPQDVAGNIVAIVDEISDSGNTMAMIADHVIGLGASQVITATLVSHSWAEPAPQVCSLVTDEFVIFPWDRRVLEKGKWRPHPEVAAGLKAQGHG